MIKIKRKNLINSIILIGCFFISIIILLFIFNAKKIEINIDKEIISKTISKELPIKKVIEIKNKIPEGLKSFKEFSVDPVLEITTVNTEFKEGLIYVNTMGELKFKDKSYPIYLSALGKPAYKNFAFYFEAEKIKINCGIEYSKMIKEIVEENMNVDPNNIIFKKIKEKTIEGLNKYFENPERNHSFDVFVESQIDSILKDLLQKKPLYTLHSNLKESGIKIGLSDIEIHENGVKLIISIQQIFLYSTLALIILIIVLTILYYVIKYPSEIFLGIFEVTFETISEI